MRYFVRLCLIVGCLQAVAGVGRAEDDPALGVKSGSGLSFRDRTKDGRACPDCPEMVVVPSGSFSMGSSEEEIAALKKEYNDVVYGDDGFKMEGPQRRVTIAKAFAVGKFEVTFAEWDACVAAGGCSHPPSDQGWGRGKQPVMNVSWIDITQQYLPWLRRKTGKTYRLLTEAEWEYAARAGTTTRYAFGDTINKSQAQFSEGKWGSAGKPVAVGSFQPNLWGLYDMHGNVSEWVQDCYHDSYSGAPLDGSAWTTSGCNGRVARGGSWDGDPGMQHSAYRAWGPSDDRYDFLGFRVARAL